ncbi:nucleolar rRNA processing protein, putative [Plasmodium reichenowi]|uniref:U3 small nucleolar RNA-associated protein 11 n=1 Tax=Plasmodium reichenowi TaxID=5854 RepID=A0A151L9F2_PLARE|nr:nucleolar rRNA processing protein, putative [Plasmodium reichenowi]KYN95578.1 nucleolar rRNA processing protein, putative [Plasmodium reichenowi]SOV80911.1 nucleolar rRNA processing protein, putative [Plasmodium reichenowi]
MSNFKNIIPKRTYLERGQAKHRLHLGELEKKVDYGKRREIYKKKKKIENVLKEKIMTKNPDEFHTGMVHSRVTEDNVLVREEKVLKKEVQLKNKRQELKEQTNDLYNKLKKIHKRLANYQMNIPLRYVFNNSHELYNENEIYTLKAENKKLKKRGDLIQKKYNGLINMKKNLLDQIRKLDNKYITTYHKVDGYNIVTDKGKTPYRLYQPRLK